MVTARGWKPAGRLLLALAVAVCAAVSGARASDRAPHVVADIAPVHSLVAQVMAGVGEPDLLLRAGASPHDYALSPSEARMLGAADIVVWTGPALTPWLQDTLAVLAPDAVRVTVSQAPGVTLLPFREGVRFDGEAPDEEEQDGHDHADPGAADPHLWLDPRNAAALVSDLARVLSERDPDNAARYRANAQAARDALAALEAEIEDRIAPARSRPFLVFHDAYHYFEARFGIAAAGSVAVSDAVPPGAARLRALQALIAEQGVVCVFAEPQFAPKLLARLTGGTAVRTGVLDPVGAGIAPGPDHYGALLRAMAGGLADCLAP